MQNANLYSNSNALQRRDSLVVLQELIPQMHWNKEDETVLDIGCGSGDITRNVLLPLLPDNTRRVVGVDLSPEMVRFASKHFEHSLIEFKEMDIANAQFPRQIFPEGFSKITSFYCLHWVQDQEACLKNIFNLLQEGGQALLVFLANNPIFDMYERISLKTRWKSYMEDVQNFIPIYQYMKEPSEYFRILAERVGFQIDLCKIVEMTYPFDNVNYLKKAISAVNPFIKRIPEDFKDAFLTDCLQELLNMSPRGENGETVAHYKLIVSLLTKTSLMKLGA